MDNLYYVYVYLDPRKKDIYKYGNFLFENEPFYVGKGKGNRYKQHLQPYHLKKQTYMSKKLNKLLRKDITPIIKIIECDITDQDAKFIEVDLIKYIGRINKGLGPLTNLTDGGDGSSGRKCNKETKLKISISNKGKTKGRASEKRSIKLSDSTKEKMSKSTSGIKNPMFDKKHKKTTIEKMSIIKKGNQYGRKISNKIKDEIIKLYSSGEYTQLEIGNIYNVHRKTIGKVIRGYK